MCFPLAKKTQSVPFPTGTEHPSSLASLGSQSSLGALAVAVVASPKAVKLTEVHVRRDPARLVRLSRLAAPLAEQAAISRAGAGALCLGVGGLEGGRGALAAGESGGIEEGGGDRWLVGEGRGIRGHGYEGGDRGGRCGANGGEEGVHVGGGETEQRGGKRERTGGRRGGGEGEEGGREGQRRERTEGVERGKREFNYGLQDVDRSLAGSGLERARGAEKRGKARTERRTRDGYRRVGTNEGEKYQSDGERQEDGEVIPADEQAKGRKMERDKSAQILA